MDRRDFLKISTAITLGAAASPWLDRIQAAAEKSSRPNILVFLTDDHGPWAQHVNGTTELQTPNLDGLAARGVRFTNAFTTCPVCSPARASFFTGLMPSQHGVHDWLDETMKGFNHPGLKGQTLIGELLQKAGYYTGLVGKWHCDVDREPHHGFDSWFSYWVNQYPHKGTQNFSDNGKHVVEQGYQSPLLTNHAIDFLKQRRQSAASKPFFLFVGYVDTHGPHDNAPPDLVEHYRSTAKFSDIPDEKFASCHGTVRSGKAAKAEKEREKLCQYYGAVGSIDREVGRIIDELKAAGEFENTLIVYTGDHGLNCGHHGIWEKGNGTLPQNFFDESVKVNCTFSWPAGGYLQNAVCTDFVNHCDLWATLLDIAGATPDAATAATLNSPGRSYLNQLLGKPAANWPDAQISEYGNARMIRTADWKLILRYPYAAQHFGSELYDMKNDPRETVNLFADPKQSDVVKSLTARIDAFFDKYTVPGKSGLALQDQPACNPGSPWLLPMPVSQR
jgi:arylsulfatase A-like enzyme